MVISLLLVGQNSRLATMGYEVYRLEQVKAERGEKCYRLEADVASLRSLDRVEQEAITRLGMITPTQYLYVSISRSSQAEANGPILSP